MRLSQRSMRLVSQRNRESNSILEALKTGSRLTSEADHVDRLTFRSLEKTELIKRLLWRRVTVDRSNGIHDLLIDVEEIRSVYSRRNSQFFLAWNVNHAKSSTDRGPINVWNCIFLLGAIGGFITYILPAILFFFLRQSQEQTTSEATKYLSIIAFYGYVFWLLSSLIWISESCLIAVTLGDNLWKLKQRLSRLHSFHVRRLRHDQVAGIKLESPDLIQFSKLRIIVPDDFEQRVLQSNINLVAKRGECVLVSGSTGCGKTSLFRICAGLWPIDAECVRLPARKQTIYVPQRPYLPIGSLRFQALFLLDIRGERDVTLSIDDKQVRDLFELVQMDYILDRYDLDTVGEKTWIGKTRYVPLT